MCEVCISHARRCFQRSVPISCGFKFIQGLLRFNQSRASATQRDVPTSRFLLMSSFSHAFRAELTSMYSSLEFPPKGVRSSPGAKHPPPGPLGPSALHLRSSRYTREGLVTLEKISLHLRSSRYTREALVTLEKLALPLRSSRYT